MKNKPHHTQSRRPYMLLREPRTLPDIDFTDGDGRAMKLSGFRALAAKYILDIRLGKRDPPMQGRLFWLTYAVRIAHH